MHVVEVNEVVREKALPVGAQAWLDSLPELVEEVKRDWGITVDAPYHDSSEAFVAEATCDDGTPAVLKLVVPRDNWAAEHEIAALRLADGDVHQWNALQAGEGFKLVDPDGLLAEPEYDLGIIMREDPLEGDLHERSRWLAAQTGLDQVAIWEWGAVERVSTGLLCLRVGLEAVGREMLAAADRVAE